MNNIELIEKELGEDIFPIALSSVRRLMMLARRDEREKLIKQIEELHKGTLKSLEYVDMAGNVKVLIKSNQSVKIDEGLKKKLRKIDDSQLVKITKTLGSINIVGVEEITKDLLAKEL